MVNDPQRALNSQRLHDCLDELAELLRSINAVAWSRMAEDLNSFGAAPNRDDMEAILRMFGGMGSMSDWVVSKLAGHTVEGKNIAELNRRLDALRKNIFDLAKSLLATAVEIGEPRST